MDSKKFYDHIFLETRIFYYNDSINYTTGLLSSYLHKSLFYICIFVTESGRAQLSEDSCDSSELQICVDMIKHTRTPVGLPRTKEELDAHCQWEKPQKKLFPLVSNIISLCICLFYWVYTKDYKPEICKIEGVEHRAVTI